MSNKHPLEIERDEHDDILLAKKVTIVSSPTVYAIVDITVGDTVSLKGNLTLSDSKGYIGLTTATVGNAINLVSNITVYSAPYSYYSQNSLISGFAYHGFALPGSNPTTANFKILRETLNTGEMLFGGAAATFVHSWSAASLASLSYL